MQYTNIEPQFSLDFDKLINQANAIVITGHESPDGDSIASVLSMYEIVSLKFPQKNLRIIYTGKPETRFHVFKNHEKIEFVDDLARHLADIDTLIMLDGSRFNRFSKEEAVLRQIPQTICIDHHATPFNGFTLSLVASSFSSCSEIIYRLFCQNMEVDKKLAETFLLGILSDTGNFTYLKPNQTDVLTIAKKLLDIAQIEVQEFISRYDSISKREFDIVQEFIKNTQYGSCPGWPDFQYTFVGRNFKDKGNYTEGEISEAGHIYTSDFLRTIEGYTWGFLLSPKEDGRVGVSCRSLPKSVNVRDFMERMNIGGGHDRASGGEFASTDNSFDVETSLAVILNWIKNNPPLLS